MEERPIEDFLSIYPKQSTRRTYAVSLRAFLDSVYGPQRAGEFVTPAELEIYEALAADYLSADRNYASDIIRAIGRSEVAPKTIRYRVATVVEFLAHHGRGLSADDRRRVRGKIPRGGTVSKRGDVDATMIRAIVGHLEEHGRTLVLVLASSGMRIGEAVKIRLGDLNLDAVPAVIEIRPEFSKNNTGRVTFMSSEAVDEVRSWLEVRGDYLTAACERASGCVAPKRLDDPRLFPFSISNAEHMWARALGECGLDERDERTGRLIRPLHSLRAFFSSQLELGCPEPVVQELIGHEGYLTSAYRRYSRQQLADAYLAAEHHVTVLVPAEYKALKSQVGERLQAHSEILESVVLENVQLKGRLQQIEQQNATILEAAEVLKEISEHPRLRQALRESALERE